MSEHPVELMMEYPVDGCDCSNCEWSRNFSALTKLEQARELDLIIKYVAESERDE